MQPTQQQSNAIYLTDFAGQSENPSIGSGVAVGLDLFTTKTVARLSRKMNKQSGNTITALPVYNCIDIDSYIYVQDTAGKVYQSVDQGVTWAVLAGNSGSAGKGIIAFQDTNSSLSARKKYLFSFVPGDIDLYDFSSATWTNSWWTGLGFDALQNAVDINHMPFSYGTSIFFCNGNYIAQFLQNTTAEIALGASLFDPTSASTFFATPYKFQLDNGYIATNIALLPPSSAGISVINTYKPSEINVVIWDFVQIATDINVVTLPGASNPVMQMLTKNGVLYAITDKEHGVYVINGSSAQLIDRLYLRMSNRSSGGTQYTTRLSSTIYPQGADFLGPELLTGGANFPSPVTQIAGTGLYPWGVWSVNIETNQYGQTVDTGSTGVVGLRFIPSFGVINAQYGTSYAIGFVKVLSNNSVLVGWQNGATYGIDLLDSQYYISDGTTTFLESSLYLTGTRLIPRTFSSLEFNLVQPLNSGDQIQFFWRSTTGMDYQAFPGGTGTFTLASMTDNLGNVFLSGVIQTLPFQNTDYIQIAAQINTGASSNLTPQLRDVILK